MFRFNPGHGDYTRNKLTRYVPVQSGTRRLHTKQTHPLIRNFHSREKSGDPIGDRDHRNPVLSGLSEVI